MSGRGPHSQYSIFLGFAVAGSSGSLSWWFFLFMIFTALQWWWLGVVSCHSRPLHALQLAFGLVRGAQQ